MLLNVQLYKATISIHFPLLAESRLELASFVEMIRLCILDYTVYYMYWNMHVRVCVCVCVYVRVYDTGGWQMKCGIKVHQRKVQSSRASASAL